ncbi:MAG: hypothetical protein FWH53_02675 [Leptospirales bacterium]|nr:hypothetical protein [Leptospirales bacterium]
MGEVIINAKITDDLKGISSFIDYTNFNRIINKLTDYGEIITEGKLASLINFNYRLNASQANMVIELLVQIQAISKVYAIAQKGKRDLDLEFISNIFSDVNNPASSPSFLSIRNLIESRLNSQLQQYNMNMNKSNTTMPISINEIHGHVQTFSDLINNNISTSHKARHGYIMGSLHDALVIILNKINWWNDKTYLKFFSNEDNSTKKGLSVITREPRLTIFEIGTNIDKVVEFFKSISIFRTRRSDQDIEAKPDDGEARLIRGELRTSNYSDKLLSTPFGIQYGQKIDEIIKDIFSGGTFVNSEDIKRIVQSLYQSYKNDSNSINSDANKTSSVLVVNYILQQDYGIKRFTEEFLYQDRKILFAKFFAENKDEIEEFLIANFIIFFEERFNSIFRIIKSLDMKQYACAFIMKRLYIIKGEDLPVFGYFLIKAIARYGKIKAI